MKLREVVNCHGCLRATRDWSAVELRVDGKPTIQHPLCRRCVSDASDSLRRHLAESRGAAVHPSPAIGVTLK